MKKKNYSSFWWILSILFLIFSALIIAYDSGYYEANISRKSKITQNKIEEFETDVKEGKDIDIKDYIESDFKDYSSPMSKVGSKLSSTIDDFMNNGFTNFFSFVSRLFT